MSDALTIAAAGVRANISALSDAASALAAATAAPTEAPAPAPVAPPGFLLAYNPDAPFANLQDLVAVPNPSPEAAITGALQAANGVRANLVVYRIASHLYRSLLNR
jgi:hypothetical protein